jgi:hypothetical protein
MKKMIVGAAVFVLALTAIRRFGPTVGKRAMTKCREMMARDGGDPGAEVTDPCVPSKEEPAALAAAGQG